MLIIKGGISRNIEEKYLQEYLDKGYKPVETVIEEQENLEDTPKPIKKMKTAELEEKALELGLDISDCKNNEERAKRIQEALNIIQEGEE